MEFLILAMRIQNRINYYKDMVTLYKAKMSDPDLGLSDDEINALSNRIAVYQNVITDLEKDLQNV